MKYFKVLKEERCLEKKALHDYLHVSCWKNSKVLAEFDITSSFLHLDKLISANLQKAAYAHLPISNLVVLSVQWKHQNNVWNLFKVNNTRMMSLTETEIWSWQLRWPGFHKEFNNYGWYTRWTFKDAQRYLEWIFL